MFALGERGDIMGDKIRVPSLLKRLARDTSGAFSLMWAVSMTGIIISVGATYDLSQLTKARALAQYAADNMALAASIAVDTDNDDRFVANTAYPYSQIGAGGEDFTGSMTGSVQYDIVDSSDSGNADLSDEEKSRLLARAIVSGTYKPAFMSIVPGLGGLSFSASSDVAYAAREGTPASIFFAVDNSGSMGWSDTAGVQKLFSLKESLKSFMATLNGIAFGDDVFRTAIYPYHSSLLTNHLVDPAWSALSDGEIDQMTAQGGTRSTAALSRARSKFSLENQIHTDMNGEEAPLKFLIFMSDGANNGAYMQQQCTTEEVWVDGESEHWKVWYYGQYNTHYRYENWFQYYYTIHVNATQGGYEDQQVCHGVPYSPVNEASLAECSRMKTDYDVKIYSIAYDIDDDWNTSWDDKAMAEQFMKDCSSGEEDYYKYAEDGADLQAVFDEIGDSVVTEVIRVKR